MKLISMTDFVLQQYNEAYSKDQFVERVEAYANFLKEPLKLEMFIPCDEYGNILEKPELIDERYNLKLIDYEQALENVFFKGFYVKMYEEPQDGILGVIKDDNNQFKGIWYEGEEGFRLNDICSKQRIEDLISCNELTQVAIDRIFG
ncbi:MAG: hypothetical protein R2790_10590 [Flavobacterium haoranii]